ncbi:MAG: SMC-Scp complex subunit ScpB, partial [Gammaproteobacteria bacterium]|nr:SMC-Scp complex subunit ScpB [Gammaproteobacteria bacterium]
ELKQVASGFRFQVRTDFETWIVRLWEQKPPRYSRAMMETLALIAYRQPITRGEIEDIRGVSVSTNIIRTLEERNWVKSLGHKEVPGRPALYGTTREFLDYFNLKSLNELPSLVEIRDLDQFTPELAFTEDSEAGTG